MKRIIVFSLFAALLLTACEPTEDIRPSEVPVELDLATLDLSGLELELGLGTTTLDFGHADPAQLKALTHDLVAEFMQQDLEWLDMTVTARQTVLHYGGDGPSVQKARGYDADGWTTVEADGGLCRSEECVRERLETAFEEAGKPGVGECVDTRVHRSLTGAAVCWKKGKC